MKTYCKMHFFFRTTGSIQGILITTYDRLVMSHQSDDSSSTVIDNSLFTYLSSDTYSVFRNLAFIFTAPIREVRVKV